MTRLSIDAHAPGEAALAPAAAAIGRGAVVALPTDTLYGLAVDPFSERAVARLFAVKGRSTGSALPLMAADVAQVVAAFGSMPPLAARLAEEFWPGPLTLLLLAPASLAAEVSGGTGRVGVRVPNHAVARGLCRACGHPLTATSANRSGEPATADPSVLARAIGEDIDLLLDAGPAAGGPPSTIVDVTGDEPRLVRAGAIGWEQVLACVHRR